MKRRFSIVFIALLVVVIGNVVFCDAWADQNYQIQDAGLHTALDDYIARPEPDFKWSVEKKVGDATVLKMDSQRWQDEIWHHQVIVIPPKKNTYPDTAMLLINVGDMTEMIPLMQQAASLLGTTFVALDGIPAQPRWDRKEDALIAYTFKQWYSGGDDTWPLLLPMTKSAIKAMDAVQQFSGKHLEKPITKFVALGGSKRGWTTWLVAAEDKRVTGIVPIVFNMLNFSAQLPHQKDIFGDYSPMIGEYVEINLPQALTTPRGKILEQIVDPWAYRERITVPKLIINSTNDPYFALDAERFYRDGLQGPSNFYDVPNAGHGEGMPVQALMSTMIGWFHWLQSGKDFPQLDLTQDKSTFTLHLKNAEAKSAVLWIAHSPTQDFRTAKWSSVPMHHEGAAWQTQITPSSDAKYTTVFAEAEFAVDGTFLPMKLSSQIVCSGQ